MRNAVPLIVIAQLFGTSLWFSANGVGDQLLLAWGLSTRDLGTLTSAVQLGFIAGTLLFAVSGTADRFHASRLFLAASLCGALANLGLAWVADSLTSALVFRFLTGLALAGIYPVGMKLVVSWAPQRRGEALAWLVGMLTLGTATPHLLQGLGVGLDWPWVVSLASALAVLGGVMVVLLGDGPHLPRAARLDWGGVFAAFRRPGFRAAAFGYFGHMWELYALWVLVPLLLAGIYPEASRHSLSLLAFAVIGIGALGCVLAGRWSRQIGSAPVAVIALATSGLLCLVYPWLQGLPEPLLLAALLLWGLAVIADSAQYSALASQHAPPEGVASALAIMNSIGFALSALAIPLVSGLWDRLGVQVSWLMLPGAVLGVLAMRPLLRPRQGDGD
ncbi:MAG: MFS transporter [Gammaproteobacteria bacterium]|nr:MFS transporter [Gammaproteobacteria bacterium]MDX5375677.1 MFS transporter [Gammaproteobacteria bacterium]